MSDPELSIIYYLVDNKMVHYDINLTITPASVRKTQQQNIIQNLFLNRFSVD